MRPGVSGPTARPVAGAALAFALTLLVAGGARASEVVMLGDSWAVFAAPSVEAVLASEGLGALSVAHGGVGGSTAGQWAAGAFDVPGILAANADVALVHIILGGNDLLAAVSAPDLAVAINQIAADVTSVAADVAAQTGVPILVSGYDYLPNPPLPVAFANTALIILAAAIEGALAAHPVAGPQTVYLDTNGLMQVHFGVPQLGIPPFDPSLPNAQLPGPTTAFADAIHLTAQGYAIYAQNAYDSFYGAILEPPACADGADNDGDGQVDGADPGCDGSGDDTETSPLLPCDDGVDNDGDGDTDHPDDPGCTSLTAFIEMTACDDDLDNDGDGAIDWDGGPGGGPADAFCAGDPTGREAPGRCGLGFELALLVPLLRAARRRRRPAREVA